METNVYSLSRIFSGTLLVAGTATGAGMLGIPLLTGAAGFWPAMAVTIACWLFMTLTGLLFLEISLKLPEGSNILSMASQYLGARGKWVAGAMFLFLYYSLLVAYFAGGGPILGDFLGVSGIFKYLAFALIFGGIVAFGAKVIDRANIILVAAMTGSYLVMISLGSSAVEAVRLQPMQWSAAWMAIPVLFSAFGYHNVIPSLRTYLRGDKTALRISIIGGTTVSLVIYLLWQWLMIGAVPPEALAAAQAKGQTAISALQAQSGGKWLYPVGRAFAFFALVTSFLGVAFSMVDFLRDAWKRVNRSISVGLALIPPLICAVIDPSIFDRALGYAGGFGEAFLNGLLPVALAWIARVGSSRPVLIVLGLIALAVMGLEAYVVLKL